MNQAMEAMKSWFWKIRNEALAKAFAYMGLIVGRGSDMPERNSLLREAGLKEMEIMWRRFLLEVHHLPRHQFQSDDRKCD